MSKQSRFPYAEKDKDRRKKPLVGDEGKLDEALDETFPASDPPAMTEPTEHIVEDNEAEKPKPSPTKKNKKKKSD